MDQDLDNKFRLVTAMHCNGPLPQVKVTKLYWHLKAVLYTPPHIPAGMTGI